MTDQRRGSGLRAAAIAALRILPPWVGRSATVAVVLSAALGLMEFLALVLLFPVFTFLADPGSTTGTLSLPWGADAWSESTVQWAAAIALALMMARSLASLWFRNWWLGRTSAAEVELSDSVLRRYVFAPYAYHLRTHSSELAARVVAHVNLTCTAGLAGLVTGVAEALVVLGLAAALVVVDPRVGLVVVCYVAALSAAYGVVTRRIVTSASRRYAAKTATVYKSVGVLLQGIRELTVLGAREEYLEDFAQHRRVMVDSQRVLGLTREVPKAALEVALYGTVLVVLAVLSYRGELGAALPVLALYVLAGTRIVPAIARMLASLSQARTGLSVAQDLADELAELATLTAPEPASTTAAAYPSRADLHLRGIGFSYPDSPAPVLRGVDLDIPFGSFVGVVGPSGSGKTTLTSLILGLLAPTGGTIDYGGECVRTGDARWFERVAVLSQEVFLTDRTLRENLMAPQATDAQVRAALDRAGLAGLEEALAEGLDTPLREAGSRLSAGQRQRVGLARALLRNAEILVLDEPTSALDRATEARVLETLRSLTGRCTVISVAHRVETLRDADVVIALDDEGVPAVGPPGLILGRWAQDRSSS